MAIQSDDRSHSMPSKGQLRLANFAISGLFGGPDQDISFPVGADDDPSPRIKILSGINGSGKTTILKMIGGLLRLDFDLFRTIPFDSASLTLSNGSVLSVKFTPEIQGSLSVAFGAAFTRVGIIRDDNRLFGEEINLFRSTVLPVLSGVRYDLLLVDRGKQSDEENFVRVNQRTGEHIRTISESLKTRVADFMISAQVDYRRYFRASELDLLPRILRTLDSDSKATTGEILLKRLNNIKSRAVEMRRYGLQTDDDDLNVLITLLSGTKHNHRSLAVIATYVDTQETIQSARELIAKRLIHFERIMDDFLTGTSVKVDASEGLIITSSLGKRLTENHLSSGEYHFLFMMVSALLCQRVGSVIAIDEPELSLHVVWQRKLVSALAQCAEGASPLFLLATHSIAISAEHKSDLYEVNSID